MSKERENPQDTSEKSYRLGGQEVPDLPGGLSSRLDKLSPTRIFLIIVLPLFIAYFAAPSLWGMRSIDPFTNTLTAHTLATEGTFYLEDYEPLTTRTDTGRGAWVVWGKDRPVSQYPPGASLHAVLPYALAQDSTEVRRFFADDPDAASVDLEVPVFWPGDLVGAATTAVAMGMLGLAFRRISRGSWSVLAAYVAGLGTSAASVAGQALWQHGPAMMWIAVATVALAYAHSATAGIAYAVAIVTRPLSAAVALAPTLFSLGARRWAQTAILVAGVGAGAMAIALYNQAVFGELSISGGYGSDRTDGVLSTSPAWYLGNVAWGLLHPRYGLLVWSPFLVVLLLGIPTAWRNAPDWVKSTAVGGLAYLALNWLLNRSSGGSAYLFYRYPLEPLVAAAPLLFMSYMAWVRARPLVRRICHVAVVVAVTAHIVVAVA